MRTPTGSAARCFWNWGATRMPWTPSRSTCATAGHRRPAIPWPEPGPTSAWASTARHCSTTPMPCAPKPERESRARRPSGCSWPGVGCTCCCGAGPGPGRLRGGARAWTTKAPRPTPARRSPVPAWDSTARPSRRPNGPRNWGRRRPTCWCWRRQSTPRSPPPWRPIRPWPRPRLAEPERYQGRCLRQLQRTFASLRDPPVRNDFWKTRVAPDPAFRRLFHLPGFQELQTRYGLARRENRPDLLRRRVIGPPLAV